MKLIVLDHVVDSCFPLAIFKVVAQPPCEHTHLVLCSTARYRVIGLLKFSSATVRLLGPFPAQAQYKSLT